jgi:hypothetical protein
MANIHYALSLIPMEMGSPIDLKKHQEVNLFLMMRGD